MLEHKVLEILKQNNGNYISGEKLSGYIGVTRTSVWKYINSLKEAGYNIESVTRNGYRLIDSSDILNEFEVTYDLKTHLIGRKVIYLKEADSTNLYARKIALDGVADGTVVVADTQTAGRGRLGRNWSSMAGKGIWMSVVLKPQISPEEVQIITIGASVAVVKAIYEVTGINAGIKWPNDIICDGKKVCGILTEMNSEVEMINFLILGMGINVNHTNLDFPDEIRSLATSLALYSGNNDKNNVKLFRRSDIIKKLLYELEQIYNKIKKGEIKDIIHDWKLYSSTLGKQVQVIYKNSSYTGTAVDLREDGRLIVKCDDGCIRDVYSGEVSVRGILGYL
jgi:BirA family biotin operon repressor/biotin-[acetyl-CoA-carboxylase] ligase